MKAGIGLARNSYKVAFAVPAFGSSDFLYGEKTSTEFSWNVGVGASYELNSQWDIYTEYQVQNVGEVATEKDSFSDRWVNDSYLIQEVNVGLRYNF